MGARIRAVAAGPDGTLWLLEDGDGGRLIRIASNRFGISRVRDQN
ncbi:PQQ-dependent sugar dehydrogenase [Sphingomonas sp. MMS24-JH45]